MRNSLTIYNEETIAALIKRHRSTVIRELARPGSEKREIYDAIFLYGKKPTGTAKNDLCVIVEKKIWATKKLKKSYR